MCFDRLMVETASLAASGACLLTSRPSHLLGVPRWPSGASIRPRGRWRKNSTGQSSDPQPKRSGTPAPRPPSVAPELRVGAPGLVIDRRFQDDVDR